MLSCVLIGVLICGPKIGPYMVSLYGVLILCPYMLSLYGVLKWCPYMVSLFVSSNGVLNGVLKWCSEMVS